MKFFFCGKNNKSSPIKGCCTLILGWILLFNSPVFSANRYWIAAGTANWNSTANWSTTSGGGSGASVPGNTDAAIFDGNGLGNCNINISINVSGIDIQTGYSGTVTQQAGFTITVGTGNFNQTAGTFTGGNSNITVTGTYTLSAGTFTSTSATLEIQLTSFTHSGGTFTHNSGTVKFTGTTTITGNTTFSALTFNPSGVSTFTISSGTTLTVVGTITIAGGSVVTLNTGTIDAQGDITITNTTTTSTAGGTATININGTVDQTLTGGGTINGGPLPNVTINKPSGTLTLASIITVRGNWTYTQGTLSVGASTVVFNVTKTITGSHTLANVTFSSQNGSYVFTIAGGTTITVTGTLTLTGPSAITINTGTIDALGDITITNIITSAAAGGTATVHINGTTDQTLTGSGTARGGPLPKVNIDKTSGTLILSSIITVRGDWTYAQGTINTGTSTVVFDKTLTITGSHILANITFYANTTAIITISSGTVLTATGTTTTEGASDLTMNTGTVESQGDVTINNSGTTGGGSATLLISGTANQNFTGRATAGEGRLPNITINKTGGTLSMINTISTLGTWTYIQGTVNAGTSTVTFYTAGNIDGQGTSSTMSFYNITLGDNTTRTMQGNLNISGVLSLGTGVITLNAYTCTLTNNSTGAITRSTGYMVSESTDNSSKVSWNIGSVSGSYVYPFATAGGTYIPFTFQLTAGDAGYVTVSTYPAASDNTPYPITPDNVTNMVGNGGTDNSSNVIDRFWQIDKNGVNGTATISYSYDQAEVTGGVAGNENSLRAQRYDPVADTWQPALPGQTADGINNVVTEPGITQFSPRTLSLSGFPLPIKLLRFHVELNGNIVYLEWATASETNNDYFVIERSADAVKFDSINCIKSIGNSSRELSYSSLDSFPFPEISYYRLKQVDLNGEYFYSEKVSVNFNLIKSNKKIIVNPNPSDGSFQIQLINISEKKLKLMIYNSSLKIISADVITIQNSQRMINITVSYNSTLSPGIYYIVGYGEKKRYTESFIIKE